MRRCRDRNEVDDVLQETLLRAARYRGSLGDPARLRAWAMRIAANVLRDHLRRQHPLRTESGEEILRNLGGSELPPGEEEDGPLVRVGQYALPRPVALGFMRGALLVLCRSDRTVLAAYYGGSLSCLQAARECGIAPDLVKVRLFRARKRLLRAMRHRLAVHGNDWLETQPPAQSSETSSGSGETEPRFIGRAG